MAAPRPSRIRQAREALPGKRGHLSREDLAHRVGVSTPTLRRWELGNHPDAEMLLALARETGRSLEWLLGADEPPPPRRRGIRRD
jgi:transcriptional regulator with XRE-family HTH domain